MSHISNISVNFIKKIIRNNPVFTQINNYVSKKPPLRLTNNYDFILDGLNLEGGEIKKFASTTKFLEKHPHHKTLIIARSKMMPQTTDERKNCLSLIDKFSNVTILYIHTHINISNKYISLLSTCKDNNYCTKQESKFSSKNTRLCTTPLLKFLKMRPVHSVCEIDDLIVLYYGLINKNSKIVSKTEKYHQRFNKDNIHHLKLFLNIPITVYSKKKHLIESHKYINPLSLLPKFLNAYNKNKITIGRNIIYKHFKN